MISISDRTFWRWYFFFVAVCSAWYLIDLKEASHFGFFLGAVLFFVATFLVIIFNKLKLTWLHLRRPAVPALIIWVVSFLQILLPSLFSFIEPIQIIQHTSERLLFLLILSGISVVLLKISIPERKASKDFLLFLLLGGVIYRIGLFVPEIQTVPFSLGWSWRLSYFILTPF